KAEPPHQLQPTADITWNQPKSVVAAMITTPDAPAEPVIEQKTMTAQSPAPVAPVLTAVHQLHEKPAIRNFAKQEKASQIATESPQKYTSKDVLLAEANLNDRQALKPDNAGQ